VIRVPSDFVGFHGKGFQTVVVAENAEKAWAVAVDSDTWETLDFEISCMTVFPQVPL